MVLESVIQDLDDGMRQQMLEDSLLIEGPEERTRMLLKLIPHLDGEFKQKAMSEALQAAITIYREITLARWEICLQF